MKHWDAVWDWLDSKVAIERLVQMRSLACVWLEDDSLPRPIYLRLLQLMNNKDISELAEEHTVNEKEILRYSNFLNNDPTIVRGVIYEYILGDILNYNDVCMGYLESYNKYSKSFYKEHKDSFSERIPEYYFVYHGEIKVWEGHNASFSVPLTSDSKANSAWAGFLISQGHRYDTTISLLKDSRIQNWKAWRSLWKWF